MDKKLELDKIAQEISHCQNCPLNKTATNPVPGAGSPNAEILFIGEAPGYWEDQKGLPFVGVAGKLLDELLGTIGLKREDVFIANMLKHRPPDNRDPLPEEIEACRSFLERQIEMIRPKVIITLGRFSMYKFLPTGKISRDHGKGQIVSYNGQEYVFVPMYHPAAALRAGAVMQELKADFLKLPAEIKKLENNLKIPEEEKPNREQLTLI